MHRRVNKTSAGFTLIEMMVSITLGMIVIAGVTGTFTAQTRQNAAEQQVSQMHQNVRGALDMIMRDLMQAGYKAPSGSVTGVTYSTTQLLVQADLDANGSIDTTNTSVEYITYVYDSTNQQITRKLGNSGNSTTEVLAENITACTFTFKDASDTATTTSSLIRKLSITITGQTAKVDPSYSSNNGKRSYSVSADVTPPNLAL
ncbi:MAG: prepilin-type N-terminal cleavage/methylation domain-containing protein [Deltaproteobacteria bacterium]|nr:prepilin-type N-terminal cleavage/methylation domain-containing protein [Deltaproteobacteria bacterium]